MKTKSKFFKKESDRNLWIKLNAERIMFMSLVVGDTNVELGDINTPYSPMWISKNQLEYDEKHEDNLRFTLEQFLTMTDKELFDFNFNKICSELLIPDVNYSELL
jgi:hypothetical protein